MERKFTGDAQEMFEDHPLMDAIQEMAHDETINAEISELSKNGYAFLKENKKNCNR